MTVQINREMYEKYKASHSGKVDVHTRLMRNYKDIPTWWFHILLLLSFALSLALCIFMKNEVQMPWWGLIFAAALASIFTLPISVITATTNQASYIWLGKLNDIALNEHC
jgi:hypothetical protein